MVLDAPADRLRLADDRQRERLERQLVQHELAGQHRADRIPWARRRDVVPTHPLRTLRRPFGVHGLSPPRASPPTGSGANRLPTLAPQFRPKWADFRGPAGW